MTPKEKALELYKKFLEYTDVDREDSKVEIYNTKQCALIAVDEILWEIIKYADNSKEYVVENSQYWEQVKLEINKI